MHNPDDNYPTRPGFEPSIPLSFEPQADWYEMNEINEMNEMKLFEWLKMWMI